MKFDKIRDERVAAQRKKINSEAFGIVMMVLLASMLVQQLWLNAPFKQYAVEFVCFFGMSIYVVIRNITLGLDIYGERRNARAMPIINSLVAGAVVTVINGILNYIKYQEHYRADGTDYFIAVLAATFISATLFSFVLLSGLAYLNKRKQDKVQKQLDEDEESE